MIGSVLKHRYEVQEKIGEGNLFNVYRCEDKIENRTVAAKVLHPQYAANRMFGERILVEAQAMVGVSHPGIVDVYDSGEESGNYYVIVEYIRGVDLTERIRRSAPFSLSTAVDVGMAICDVLDFAHRSGLVHGDLRPGNVLVTPEGQIKISDFWVSDAVAASQTIRTSAMMRSIRYMSPEVAEGGTATPSSDVYSVGIMLFEILTGKVPFDGDTPIAIALKHAREPIPSPRALNPGIPKDLESVVGRALQKSPQDRHRSAKAMLGALKSVSDALNLSRPIARSQRVEKTVQQPASEPEETDEILQAEPVILSAVRKTLLMIVLFIAIASAIMVAFMMQRPEDVSVPDLIGMALQDAQSAASDHKLQIIVRSEQFNEEYPAGVVYYTNPPGGRMIKAGKPVVVWVSKGSQYTTVPKLVNASLEAAKSKILNAGLNVGEVSQDYSETVPAGNILSQEPAEGTRTDRGQPVKLVFSLGTKPREIPFDTDIPIDKPEEPRSFDVRFTVPPGPENQTVEIRVEDRYGENVALTVEAQPGDRIEHTVDGVGHRVIIRIYIDDKLAREDTR